MKLILYHFDGCPYCGNVEAAIDRLKIRNKIEHRDILKEPKYRDELIALNGIKQVPCLVIDGRPMLESRDIIQYLEKTFGSN